MGHSPAGRAIVDTVAAFAREATLSHPRPDPKVPSTRPCGVVLWPTSTGSSITVSRYSTRRPQATPSGQTTTERGSSEAVVTERTRKSADGRAVVGRVNALYPPEQGVHCT
ncbi:MAG TPA: hypothetical protein VE760_08995 [Acidimicrobiales bacterium]|nr:hypothetical protein [Acidimicrobiales bacterium]